MTLPGNGAGAREEGSMSYVRSDVVRLTPSLVKGLRQCGHQQLWLQAHPERQKPYLETGASARGHSMHAALAEFHRAGGAAAFSSEGLRQLLRRAWVAGVHGDAEEERLARLECEAQLDAYYLAFGGDGGTLATERSCGFLRGLEGVVTEWFGRLDWARRLPGGGLEVVDWKTCRHPATPEALAADPVTVMYGRLARHLAEREFGHRGGPVRFSHVYLDRAQKVSVDLTRELVAAAERELAALARGLLRRRLPPAEGPWCAWNGGCPARLAGDCPLFPPLEVEGEW